MVITITLNPLVDRNYNVDKLIPGQNLRLTSTENIIGGKGINVSRLVRSFGGKTLALSFIGGHIGSELVDLFKTEGIPSILVRTKASTRIQVSLLDINNNKPTFFIGPNEGVSQQELDTLKFELTNVLSNKTEKHVLVISGSAPAGDMDNSIHEIINIANKFNILTILDSYGKAFKLGLTEKPFMAKQNRKEAETYYRKPLIRQDNILDYLRRMVENGIKFPIITSGKDWVYAGYENKYWKLIPTKVKVVNPTGSGDAMVGSLALDLLSLNPDNLSINQIEKMLIKSVAVGTANAMVWLPCDIAPKMVDTLIPKVKIYRIR
ncbi:MAG: 1-phosphofructokinase family hexose kinase [bacterium]